jgi:uroporphyrinogen-III synthase
MRFLLTRPAIESDALDKKLSELGHNVLIDPLMTIHNMPLNNCTLDQYQAIIFTSANGVRSFHTQKGPLNIPLFVVGDKTAVAAKKAGFTDVRSADGDVKKLALLLKKTLIAENGPLLYLSAAHISHDLEKLLNDTSFIIDRHITYEVKAAPSMNKKSIAALENGEVDFIPFYSKRSALIFIDMINKNNLQHCTSTITALALSPALEGALKALSWQAILTAENPRESDLFNLIALPL